VTKAVIEAWLAQEAPIENTGQAAETSTAQTGEDPGR